MKHVFKSSYTMVFVGLLAVACKKETPLISDQAPVLTRASFDPVTLVKTMSNNPSKTSPNSPKTPKNPIKITTPRAPKPNRNNASRINSNFVPQNLFNTGGQNPNNSNKYAGKDYIDKNYDPQHINSKHSHDY